MRRGIRRRREEEAKDENWSIGEYMQAKVRKLDEQFEKYKKQDLVDSEGSTIFENVVIFVNGYTSPPADELCRLMRIHGGGFQTYYSRSIVTHIIATNLPDNKIKEIRDKQVVHPKWITESIKQKQLLSISPYRLYSPRERMQSALNFNKTLQTQTTSCSARENNSNVSCAVGENESLEKGNPSNFSSDTLRDFKDISMSTGGNPKHDNSSLGVAVANDVEEVGDLLLDEDDFSNRQFDEDEFEISKGNVFGKNIDDISASAKDRNKVCILSRKSIGMISDEDEFRIIKENSLCENFDAVSANAEDKNKVCITRQQSSNELFSDEDEIETSKGNSVGDNVDEILAKDKNKVCITRQQSNELFSDEDEIETSKGNSVGDNVDEISTKDGNKLCITSRKRLDFTTESTTSECKGNIDGSSKETPINTNQTCKETALKTLSKGPHGSAVDSTFLGEFYSNSRLHYLSTWSAELRQFTNNLMQNNAPLRYPKNSSRKYGRVIMHIDMDSFFVSVCLREKPHLRGKPIAVCHAGKGTSGSKTEVSPDDSPSKSFFSSTSEVASCSYEARAKGVGNGMFLGEARKLCPDIICVPYQFENYRQVSQKLYETLASYTREIEAVSCDEVFADISDVVSEDLTPEILSHQIRDEIFKLTGCTASAGMAPNILLARMSTRVAKPNGQFFLQKNNISEFIGSQLVKDLPGVGRSMHRKIQSLNVNTCSDLQRYDLQTLQREFGHKTGQMLYQFCRGIDDRQIKVERERKSVSADVNYGIRFTEGSQAEKFIQELAIEVQNRMKTASVRGKHITLKLKVRQEGAPVNPSKYMGHGLCDNISRSISLAQATDNAEIIGKHCIKILHQLKLNVSDLRGIGIQLNKLVALDAGTSSTGTKTLRDFVKSFGNKTSEGKSGKETEVKNAEKSSKETELTNAGEMCRDSMKSLPSTSKFQSTGKCGSQNNLTSSEHEHQYDKEDDLRRSPKQKLTRPVTLPRTVHDKPPVLPRLPELKSPPVIKTTGRGCYDDELCLPSPSQIDMTVLNALPSELRENIMKSYANKNPESETGRGSEEQHVGPRDRHQGKENNNIPAEMTNSPSRESDDFSVLGSPSQWDPSVIASLPPELVHELREHSKTTVTSKRTSSEILRTTGRGGQSSERTKSPGKLPSKFGPLSRGGGTRSSPDKSCGRGSGKGRGRGRGKGVSSSPQKITRKSLLKSGKKSPANSPSKSPVKIPESCKITSHLRSESAPVLVRTERMEHQLPSPSQIDPDVLAALPESMRREIELAWKQEELRQRREQDKLMKEAAKNAEELEEEQECDHECRRGEEEVLQALEKESKPSLNGETDVGAVKQQLKTWVQSCEEPADEDVDIVGEYIEKLVLSKDLEHMWIVLRTFHRLILGACQWYSAFASVFNRAQVLVMEIYSCKLPNKKFVFNEMNSDKLNKH